MKSTQLEHGKFQSSIFKLGKELGESGAEVFTRIDEDDSFRSKVADYMLRGAPEQVSSGGLTYRIAKAIIGEDKTIGPETALKHFGITPNQKDLARLLQMADQVPYLPETLSRHAKTHLLVWGIPVDLNEVCEKTKSFGIRWWLSDTESEALKMSTPTKGWYLINRGTSIFDLGSDERLATVMDAFYALSLHKLTNKRQIFLRNEYGVCNLTSEGEAVCFGLGEAFTRKYADGADGYWVKGDISTNKRITVVLPDNPIK